MTEKYYLVGIDPVAAEEAGKKYDFYSEAKRVGENFEEVTGIKLKVFKVETKISEADDSTEDYWENR